MELQGCQRSGACSGSPDSARTLCLVGERCGDGEKTQPVPPPPAMPSFISLVSHMEDVLAEETS